MASTPTPMTASTTATAITDTPTLVNPDPRSNLPDPTTWLIGLLLSWLAFGLVIAVMLLMAQFPETFPWWAEMTDVPRPPPRGRKKLDSHAMGVSSAVAQVDGEGEGGGGGFRLRKPRGLSVDTQARRGTTGGGGGGEGLGILLPPKNGDEPAEGLQKKVKKRVSFDPSTSSARKNPPCQSWEAATAPLPQTKAFLQTLQPAHDEDDDDDEIVRCPDIETGHPMPNSRDLGDHYAERRASPYFKAEAGDAMDEGGEGEEAEKGSGWLGKVNRGVYRVADRVAVKFYEKIGGAEEGLLLPVRETEREGWMGRMVD